MLWLVSTSKSETGYYRVTYERDRVEEGGTSLVAYIDRPFSVCGRKAQESKTEKRAGKFDHRRARRGRGQESEK